LNEWVLHYHMALGSGMQQGKDIAFTLGPLGFLFYGTAPHTALWVYSGWIALGGTYWMVSWRCLSESPAVRDSGWKKLGLYAVSLIPIVGLDVSDGFAYGLIAWLLIGLAAGVRFGVAARISVGIAIAVLSLTKSSWGIAAIPAVFAMEVAGRDQPRRLGLVLASSAGAGLVLWMLTGQSFDSLAVFLKLTLDIAGGFAEAMSLDRPDRWWVIGCYIAGVSAIIGCMWARRTHAARAAALAMTWCAFVVLKAGFVRHDHHEVIACTFLCAAAVPAAVMMLPRGRWWLLLPSGAICLLIGSTSHFVTLKRGFVPNYSRALLQNIGGFVSACSGSLASTAQWSRDMGSGPRDGDSATWDVYPFGRSLELIRQGGRYRGRPVFESYGAYTPALAGLNRQHLIGDDGPQRIRVSIRPLDRLLPAMMDGHSWPELMARYKVAALSDGLLVLERSPAPGSVELTLLKRYSLASSREIVLSTEPKRSTLWLEVDVPLTWHGRLVSFLWKIPPMEIELELEQSDGVVISRRLVRRTAKAGFIVSPMVSRTSDLAMLIDGSMELLPNVRRIRFIGGGAYCWDEASVSVWSLGIERKDT
jgi:hypothetical protein